jgi:predicted metalloendopeptidase
MKWNLLNSSTALLSTQIEEANFDFYGKTLTGAIKQRP